MHTSLLVADEETWAIEAVSACARSAGLRVLVASNGIDALERFKEHAPAAVVCDQLLPVMNGSQLAVRIRQTVAGRTTPIILCVSPYGPDPQQLRAELGLTAVLSKPYSTSDLSQVLEPFVPLPDEAAWEATLPLQDAIDISSTSVSCELLRLGRERWSGRLVLHRAGILKELVMRDGRIAEVGSNSLRDGWPRWLMRDGVVDPRRRATAARIAEETPWASREELQELGLVRQREVADIEARRATAIALDLTSWIDGDMWLIHDDTFHLEPLVDAVTVALWGLRCHGETFGLDTFLPERTDRLCQTAVKRPADLTALESQVINLVDGERPLMELLALAKMVQLDARPVVSYLCATGALEQHAWEPSLSERPDVFLPQELGGETVPAKGLLEDIPAVRLLAVLWSSRSTGIVHVKTSDSSQTVHIQDGRPVFARSSALEMRLGRVLLDLGKINDEEHSRALAAQAGASDRRIGAILVAHGALTLSELHYGLVEQLKRIVWSIVGMSSGTYAFMRGELPTDDCVRTSAVPQLIVEGCRLLQLSSVLLRHLPSDTDLLMRTWDDNELAKHLVLNDTEKHIVGKIGSGITLQQLVRSKGLDQERVLRTLHGLLSLGVVHALPSEECDTEPGSAGQANLEDLLDTQDLDPLRREGLRRAYAELKVAHAELELENERLRRALAEHRAEMAPA